MIYTGLVKKACDIMYAAHKNDRDKGGYPYVFHPFYLATRMPDEASVCVALLHDVIEDHCPPYSFEYLENEGFGSEIIAALRLLTHEEGVPYMDYVKEIAKNPIARRVKIADLEHNMDSTRIGGVRAPKYETYKRALEYLKNNA